MRGCHVPLPRLRASATSSRTARWTPSAGAAGRAAPSIAPTSRRPRHSSNERRNCSNGRIVRVDHGGVGTVDLRVPGGEHVPREQLILGVGDLSKRDPLPGPARTQPLASVKKSGAGRTSVSRQVRKLVALGGERGEPLVELRRTITLASGRAR